MIRLPALLLAMAVVPAAFGAQVLPPVDSGHWTSRYDGNFRKYAKRYFGPHFDWRWFKAQAIAESRLDPRARSAVGAVGVMQLMPATFEEIQREKPHFADPKQPRWNIAAGIYYDRQLFRKWRGLPELDRLYLAFASYNAGYGRIRKASRQAEPPLSGWPEVRPHTPGQTRHYVKTIRGLMEARAGGGLKGIARLLK